MDFKRLRTFVTVADRGTVSQAAVDLRIAQPALSRQISELERQLGVKLFDRVGRRLALTAEGEQLLVTCRDVLGGVTSLGEQGQLLKRGGAGQLNVATSSILIETVFATFLHHYTHLFPNVRVKLVEAVGSDVPAMIERGE